MSIIKQSEVMTWTEGNINTAPETCGVYTLRTGAPIASIGYVGSAGAGRLRARLNEQWTSRDHPRTTHFHWVQCTDHENALKLERDWIARYRPPWNK